MIESFHAAITLSAVPGSLSYIRLAVLAIEERIKLFTDFLAVATFELNHCTIRWISIGANECTDEH